MDWSNERYVRVYTRDSTTWKIIDWQARTLLLLLLRKVDRAGVLDVGTDGVEGLAAQVELPIDIVERGLPQLLSRGVVVKTADAYVMPNFLDAQEAVQSDAMRQRESREKRRAKSLGLPDPVVTKRDVNPGNASRNVTETPDSVTPASPSDPSRPSRASEKKKREKKSSNSAPDAAGFQPLLGGLAEKKIAELVERGDPRTNIEREVAKWVSKKNGGKAPTDADDAQIAGWLQLHEDWLEKQGMPTAKRQEKKQRSSRLSPPLESLPAAAVFYLHPDEEDEGLLAYAQTLDADYMRVYLGTYEFRDGRVVPREHQAPPDLERGKPSDLDAAMVRVADAEEYLEINVKRNAQ